MKNLNDKKFKVDKEKCIQCGLCTKICWNGALTKGAEGYPELHTDYTDLSDEWHMCWECQRCMAVCPTAALSICGKDPADSVPADRIPSAEAMEALILNRRSCRSFQQKNVDKDLITHILSIVNNLPTGSNNQLLQFALIDDIETMNRFRKIFYEEFWRVTGSGVYPERFPKKDIDCFREYCDKGEEFVFRGAPHLLIPYSKIGKGDWECETNIALAYTELLMNTYGLGTIILSTPWQAMTICPHTTELLGIPENCYPACYLAFGWPAIRFPRGVQRFDYLKIHRPQFLEAE